MAVVGAVMKASGGCANAEKARELIIEIIENGGSDPTAELYIVSKIILNIPSDNFIIYM